MLGNPSRVALITTCSWEAFQLNHMFARFHLMNMMLLCYICSSQLHYVQADSLDEQRESL